MSTTTQTGPGVNISPDDRLGLTISLAIIVHVIVVLGVSFAPEPTPDPRFEALEIILVPQKSAKAPEDADLLAQANLIGGGDASKSTPPAAPVKSPIPAQTADIASSPPPPVPAAANSAAIVAEPAPPAEPSKSEREDGAANVEQRLVQTAADSDLGQANDDPQASPEASPNESKLTTEQTPQPEVNSPRLPTAAQLLTRSFALASLNAELQQRLDSKAKSPRRKYISANTREYRYAAYMEAWRAKVERIGNINYPSAARSKRLSGNLLLDVAINPDGSVREITVRRSSGHKMLDDAAVRIVELAAPYAPFPPEVLEEVDILHITRTWKFVNNQDFRAR